MEPSSSIHQVFISQLDAVLDENYHNENFGVNELARAVGVSRSQLHRKLSRTKGISASEIIKRFRLEKAHELLRNNSCTVSEIAYSVGFNSPSYFSKCFHKYYNYSPSEVKNKTNQELLLKKRGDPNSGSLFTLLVNSFFKHYLHIGKIKIRTLHLALLLLLIISIGVLKNSEGVLEEPMPKSIAILPFEAISKSINSDILSDGIHQGLESSLGKINRFKVLSRKSTLKYKDSKITKENIIKELGVDFLVSGKIHHSDNDSLILDLRVDKLGASEVEFQTLNYHSSIENIMAIQNEASKGIGAYTGVLPNSAYSEVGQNSRKINKNAYKNYIRGMYYLHKSTQDDFDKGIQFLYKALDVDPAEPLAYAGLAYGHVILGHSSAQNRNVFSTAKMAANKAIELDSTLLESYASMASIAIYHDRDWKEAEDLFQFILTRNPSMANVHYDYAWYWLLVGDKKKALYHHDKAEKLDPFNVKYKAWAAWMLAFYGHYEDALEKVRSALIKVPNSTLPYLAKGFIHEQRGDTAQALQAYKKLYELNARHGSYLGAFYAKVGELEKAHKILEEVKNWPESPWKNWSLAVLYAGLNDVDSAVRMLETEPKHAFVAWAAVDPIFESIKEDDGFKTFVSGLNLPTSKFGSKL